MKKLRTIKPIPGIPVGSILKKDSCCYRYSGVTPYNYSLEELEGFVEEVKEQEEFWGLNKFGQVVHYQEYENTIPNWLRFRTKESAEKFAKACNDSHGADLRYMDACQYEIISALNDRVK